jgi:hypothetical protein
VQIHLAQQYTEAPPPLQDEQALGPVINDNEWIARDSTAVISLAGDGPPRRKIYTFCMCPGGQIVPTATEDGELCINGMSFSKRDSQWANSAIVAQTEAPDWAPYEARHHRIRLCSVNSFCLSASTRLLLRSRSSTHRAKFDHVVRLRRRSTARWPASSCSASSSAAPPRCLATR